MATTPARSRIPPPYPVSHPDYTSTATCKNCGYALRGLPVARCPECGLPFDPGNPRTMNVPGWRAPLKPPKPFPYSFGQCVLAASLSATVIVLLPGMELPGWILGYFIWIAVLAAWLIAAIRWRFHPPTDLAKINKPLWWRPAVLALLGLTLILGIRIAHCPHATQLLVGPVPITLVGKACHNGQEFRSIYTYLWERRR